MKNYLTPIEIKRVDCPKCLCGVGNKCVDTRQAVGKYFSSIKSFHAERKEAARKFGK